MQIGEQPVLVRPNISQEIASRLRELVINGTLLPGQRINEVHVAGSLHVSRTPLREALSALVSEGTLTSVPRRGFFVCELAEKEFRDLYSIRALLDPRALELAGIPSPDRLGKLERLNKQLLAARGAETVVQLDNQWHLELLADCPNAVLIELIRQFMQRTRRYELALMRERGSIKTSTEDHRRILRALKSGDLKGACRALRQNMESGTGPILEWLSGRGTENTGE